MWWEVFGEVFSFICRRLCKCQKLVVKAFKISHCFSRLPFKVIETGAFCIWNESNLAALVVELEAPRCKVHQHDVRIRDHLVQRMLAHSDLVCGLDYNSEGMLASGGNDAWRTCKFFVIYIIIYNSFFCQLPTKNDVFLWSMCSLMGNPLI